MKITFYNHSPLPSAVQVDQDEKFLISPYESAVAEAKGEGPVCISVSSGVESWRDKKDGYVFSLEAVYRFDTLAEGQNFHITHQRDKAGLSVYLDRMFLEGEELECVEASLHILGLETIRKIFCRACRRQFLLVTPIEETPGLVILGVIGGAVLAWYFGWKAAAIYFPALYSFILLFNFVTGKIGDKLFKRVFNTENEKQEFENLCQEEHLLEYYRVKKEAFKKDTDHIL